MSLFQKRGLLLDNKLSDVSNKATAVNNILRLFADNDADAFSLNDLAPLIGISEVDTFDATQAFTRIGNNLSFTDPDAEDGFSLATFKNRLETIDAYVKTPVYFGGNGLTGRFYTFDDLPDSFIESLNDSPLDLFSENSPTFSIEDLKTTIATSGPRGDLFHNGNMTFARDSIFSDIPNIRVAFFNGFVRFANNDNDVPNTISRFAETFSGFTLNYNPNEITNVLTKIILEDVNTGERLIDFTFEPDDNGVNNLLGSNNAFLPNTRYANKYELFKISIVYIISDDILTRFPNDDKKVTISFRNARNSTISSSLTRTYFHTEDYVEPTIDNSSTVRKKENQALIKYGSFLNLDISEPNFSPEISEEEDISNQIGAPSTYNDIIFQNKLSLTYEAQSGGYDSVKKLNLNSGQYTLGENCIITNSDSVENVELGNYVHGLKSESNNPIYVTGVSTRDRAILLSEKPVYYDDSPADETITIIDHNGLINIGDIEGSPDTFTSRFENTPDLRAGDFVYLPSQANGFKYIRIKSVTPLVFEKIANNNTVSEITAANESIFVYKQSALDNQILDKFCILDNSSPFQGDLIKLEVVETLTPTDNPANIITVSDNVVNYEGDSIDVLDSPSILTDKFVVFDGVTNAVIPANTSITTVTDNGDGTLDITLANDAGGYINQTLFKGSILTVADDFNTANVKFTCFPPTDPSAPFVADGENIALDSAAGRDAVDFTTGTGSVVEFSFNGLKLDDTSSPSIIQDHSGDATFDTVLKIKDSEGEGEEYKIPLITV